MPLKLTSLLVLATATAANGQSLEVTCGSVNAPATSVDYYASSTGCLGVAQTGTPDSTTGCATNPADPSTSARVMCTSQGATFQIYNGAGCTGSSTDQFIVPLGHRYDLTGGGGGSGGGTCSTPSGSTPEPEDNRVKCDFKIGGAEFKCEWCVVSCCCLLFFVFSLSFSQHQYTAHHTLPTYPTIQVPGGTPEPRVCV